MDGFRLVEMAITVLGGIGTAAAALLGGYKLLSVLLRNWRTLNELHAHFGDNPIGVLTDLITDIEASHGELDMRRRMVERHLGFGIFVANPAGETTWVNDVLAESFGLDTTEMMLHGWISAVASAERSRVYKKWHEAVENLLPYEDTYTVVPESGEPWVAHAMAGPVTRKRDGKLIYFVGNVLPAKGKGDAIPQV